MERINSVYRINRLFSKWTLALCAVGLIINIAMANLVKILGIPLYVDNIGNVLAAALGGIIPGMAVGFLSNLVNSVADPISMFYAILTVLNAIAAAWFSRKGYLKKLRGCLVLAAVMMIIGGAAGSIMTWMLYGGQMGGIALPLATKLCDAGFPEFWAQFCADMAVDVPDKIITVIPVYLFLHYYPSSLYDKFSNSYIYDRSAENAGNVDKIENSKYGKTSVNIRITSLIVLSMVLISSISMFVGIRYYQQNLKEKYCADARNISSLVADSVDGNRVEDFLKSGYHAAGYEETQGYLENIRKDMSDAKYIYVYQVKEDGCHVVFDLDTEDLEGDNPGDIQEFDESFSMYYDDLIAGKSIDELITNDTFGWLITSYMPIKDDNGKTVAYGCTDISMEQYMNDLLTYIIKTLAMLFVIALVISAAALRYASMRITEPVNQIVELNREFGKQKPEEWLESSAWKNRTPVKTGDEVEELYETVCAILKSIAENVSKMKEAERQLVLSYELEKRNRELALEIRKADEESAAKSEFYSRMSHDMRTPMNGIIGLVDLSKDESDITVLHKNIEKIGISGGYLLALINDTLDMNKIEDNKMNLECKPVHVEELVDSVADMIKSTVQQKNLIFNTEYSKSDIDLYLMMDEVRVKQIFMNLISNAAKFTPMGGMISLTIKSDAERSDIDNLNMVHYKVVIKDTGCGMSTDFMENSIFQPFSQEQNNITITSAGSGLGLAIVKRLVELMGGTISVRSELGEGTEFTVELEFSRCEKPEKSEETRNEIDYSYLEGKKVLVCEDNELNREILERILKKAGVSVDNAENGLEGVEKFKKSEPYSYDAVLMDIRMPVMDGIEASGNIRNMERADAGKIPIIAMTANAYAEDRAKTKEAGMDDHLTKPIDVDMLYMILGSCIKSYRGGIKD